MVCCCMFQVDVDLMDTDGAFMLQPTGSTQDTIGEDNTKDRKSTNTFSLTCKTGNLTKVD